MPASARTRKRGRSISHSQESLRLSRIRPDESTKKGARPDHESQQQSLLTDRSLVSNSTASLPERYTVSISVPQDAPPLSADQADKAYIRGAEFLADGWRREEDVEGRLTDLRNVNKDKKPPVGLSPGAGALLPPPSASQVDLTTVWYTAALQHPCLCGLGSFESSWTPSAKPLISRYLTRLDAQPLHLNPPVGIDIPLWSVSPTVDQDQGADTLEDFIHGWQNADGSGWGEQSKPASQVSLQWSTSCEDVSEEADTIVQPPVPRADKGKGKVARPILEQLVPLIAANVAPQIPNPPVENPPLAPAEQSKRRKTEWRAEIRSSEGYGRLWEIIPRPHGLDTKYTPGKRVKTPRPPDYVLPRYYSTTTAKQHPFHPDLPSYIRERPLSRVYWLIPIHGPVHIPSYSDRHTQPQSKAPTPSPAILQEEDVQHSATRRQIQWTPALLSHFWTWFLAPLHADASRKFGSLSTKLSGPKPDPFINLPDPSPLPPWPWNTTIYPIRPEAGDHIRVYCDARYALSLRTWLHAVEVDLTSLQPLPGNPKEAQALKTYRLFDKTRLCLVGERGQVLIVA